MQKKISVIIPVYNAEKYIRQCLESIINQTFKDIEIICIDDCSKDSSFDILKEFAEKDCRIKVYKNKKNIKAGLTRNRGLELAKGEYIHFMDADDWLDPDTYERLVKYLDKAPNVDILHFLWRNHCIITGHVKYYKYNIYDITEKIININNTPDLAANWRCAPWCKLHRRQFLIDKNIRYNDFSCLEDMEHSIHVLTTAESVYLVSDVFLNYRSNNSESLMGKSHPFYNYAIKTYSDSIEHCKKINSISMVRVLDVELYTLFHILYGSFLNNCLSFKELQSIVRDIDYSIFKDNFINYKWYIYYHDITTNPAWLVKFKHYIRNFTKIYMPDLHSFLVTSRRKFKLLRKI